ncbi:MAG TPA: hypothetical protein VGM79_27550 [Streptosporangiaceae bacterium]
MSSYVGYSLDAPWGEARIVFGIAAEEAEQLAVLLDRHDCVGPVHASVTARSVGGTATAPAGDAGQPGAAGLLHVPAPAPASAGQQPLSASAVGSRHSDPLAPRHRTPARDADAASPLTAPLAPPGTDVETPIARAASRALAAALASQRDAAAVPAGQPQQASQADRTAPAGEARQPGQPKQPGQPGQPAQPGRPAQPGPAVRAGGPDQASGRVPAGGPGQAGRNGSAGPDPETGADAAPGREVAAPGREVVRGAGPEQRGEGDRPGPEVTDVFDAIEAPEVVAFRLKRPAAMADYGRLAAPPPSPPAAADHSGTDDTVQTPAPGRLSDGRNRVTSAAAHADAATWAASEVPGQAAVSDPAV